MVPRTRLFGPPLSRSVCMDNDAHYTRIQAACGLEIDIIFDHLKCFHRDESSCCTPENRVPRSLGCTIVSHEKQVAEPSAMNGCCCDDERKAFLRTHRNPAIDGQLRAWVAGNLNRRSLEPWKYVWCPLAPELHGVGRPTYESFDLTNPIDISSLRRFTRLVI